MSNVRKECPFCGRKPRLRGELAIYHIPAPRIPKLYKMCCENAKCGVRPSTQWQESKPEALRTWNRRVK